MPVNSTDLTKFIQKGVEQNQHLKTTFQNPIDCCEHLFYTCAHNLINDFNSSSRVEAD